MMKITKLLIEQVKYGNQLALLSEALAQLAYENLPEGYLLVGKKNAGKQTIFSVLKAVETALDEYLNIQRNDTGWKPKAERRLADNLLVNLAEALDGEYNCSSEYGNLMNGGEYLGAAIDELNDQDEHEFIIKVYDGGDNIVREYKFNSATVAEAIGYGRAMAEMHGKRFEITKV